MKIRRFEGIYKDNGVYNINYLENTLNDIIDIKNPQLYETELFGHPYRFGYKFNSGVSSKERSEFIDWIKEINNKTDDKLIDDLIYRAIDDFRKIVTFKDINCILYPKSDRSNLVPKIIRCFNYLVPRDFPRNSFELVKEIPSNISFDWEMFDLDNEDIIGSKQYDDIQDYVENTMLPKIQSLDYFSLSQNVKPKYRKFIKNYLKLDSEKLNMVYESIKDGDILVIDDINTTGSTLSEILRIIKSLNFSGNIYLFTLIGK